MSYTELLARDAPSLNARMNPPVSGWRKSASLRVMPSRAAAEGDFTVDALCELMRGSREDGGGAHDTLMFLLFRTPSLPYDPVILARRTRPYLGTRGASRGDA